MGCLNMSVCKKTKSLNATVSRKDRQIKMTVSMLCSLGKWDDKYELFCLADGKTFLLSDGKTFNVLNYGI